jgi:hypothetical protein
LPLPFGCGQSRLPACGHTVQVHEGRLSEGVGRSFVWISLDRDRPQCYNMAGYEKTNDDAYTTSYLYFLYPHRSIVRSY